MSDISISSSLDKFIGSGMMDYAYIESRKFSYDLSLGVNPLGCSTKVLEYYKNKDISFSNYSAVTSEELRSKIANIYNLKSEDVLIGAGVSELLHVAYLTFMNPGEQVIVPEISFPPFEFLSILTHGQTIFIPFTDKLDIDLDSVESLITTNTKIIVLCNPNNPTGKQMDFDKTETLVSKHPNIVFLIDEANIDFGGKPMLPLVYKYNNILIFRSFSKGFGLAGIRVGFVLGNEKLIYAMQRRQTPFMVNVFGQMLSEIALDDLKFLDTTKDYGIEERKYLGVELSKIGFTFIESDSNYLLLNVSSKFDNSKDFIDELNKRDANAVDGNDFRGLGGKYVRLSPRKHDINSRFIEIVREICS